MLATVKGQHFLLFFFLKHFDGQEIRNHFFLLGGGPFDVSLQKKNKNMRANIKAKLKSLKTDHSTKATLPRHGLFGRIRMLVFCFLVKDRGQILSQALLYYKCFSFQAALEGMAHFPKQRC